MANRYWLLPACPCCSLSYSDVLETDALLDLQGMKMWSLGFDCIGGRGVVEGHEDQLQVTEVTISFPRISCMCHMGLQGHIQSCYSLVAVIIRSPQRHREV